MFPSNPGMSISINGDTFELNLPNELGTYIFGRDSSEDVLIKKKPNLLQPPIVFMMSPISGNCFRYQYETKRFNEWVSIENDEHYLVEILTRELLKKMYGFPQF
jgi:frataxin-like iron-binding protein CyaY